MRWSVIALALVMTSCGDDSDSEAGNGPSGVTQPPTVGGGMSDPSGSGAGSPSQPVEPECRTDNDCRSSELCTAGSCEEMFDKVYVVTFVSARFNDYDLNGASWDGFGGAPDPIGVLYLDESPICQTSVAQDDFSPQWSESCEVRLFRTSSLAIGYFDADVTDNEAAGGVLLDPLDQVIRWGGYSGTLSNGGVSDVAILVSPK
jgi:hypothetical protein